MRFGGGRAREETDRVHDRDERPGSSPHGNALLNDKAPSFNNGAVINGWLNCHMMRWRAGPSVSQVNLKDPRVKVMNMSIDV